MSYQHGIFSYFSVFLLGNQNGTSTLVLISVFVKNFTQCDVYIQVDLSRIVIRLNLYLEGSFEKEVAVM